MTDNNQLCYRVLIVIVQYLKNIHHLRRDIAGLEPISYCLDVQVIRLLRTEF